jgi:hypothetical protein
MPKAAPIGTRYLMTLGALGETSKLQKEHTFGHGKRLVDSGSYAPNPALLELSDPLANRVQGLT